MIDAPLAIAFTSGLVATVNPCGFAMLPAYLSFFVGADEAREGRVDTATAVARAMVVGLAVSAGFAITFGVIGLVVSHLTRSVYDIGPWISVVIGVALAALGLALLLGRELSFAIPRLDRGGRSRGVWSMALFGVSYAIASLGCTLPLLLPSVTATARDANVVSGVAYFLAYAAGMAVVLTALAVTLALAQQSLLRFLRKALPYVHRIAGGLLLLAGAYVAYYGVYEIRLEPGQDSDGIVDRVTGWSSDVTSWVQDTGGTRVGLVLALVVATAGMLVAVRTTARARR